MKTPDYQIATHPPAVPNAKRSDELEAAASMLPRESAQRDQSGPINTNTVSRANRQLIGGG